MISLEEIRSYDRIHLRGRSLVHRLFRSSKCKRGYTKSPTDQLWELRCTGRLGLGGCDSHGEAQQKLHYHVCFLSTLSTLCCAELVIAKYIFDSGILEFNPDFSERVEYSLHMSHDPWKLYQRHNLLFLPLQKLLNAVTTTSSVD